MLQNKISVSIHVFFFFFILYQFIKLLIGAVVNELISEGKKCGFKPEVLHALVNPV